MFCPLAGLLPSRLPGNGWFPSYPALRPAGQRDPQGQYRKYPHLARDTAVRTGHPPPAPAAEVVPLTLREPRPPAAAARCASSRSSGAVRNRCPARHRESRPHDTTHDHGHDRPPAVPQSRSRSHVPDAPGRCLKEVGKPPPPEGPPPHAPNQTGITCPRRLCVGACCTRGPNRPRTFPIA